MTDYSLQLAQDRTITVKLTKESYGWRASTRIELTNQRVLDVTTRKKVFGKSLTTTGSVSLAKDNRLIHVLARGISGDFHQTCAEKLVPRITEKAVREQHDRFLTCGLMHLLVQIEQHYAQQAARGEVCHA
jgi:hypothetical protein